MKALSFLCLLVCMSQSASGMDHVSKMSTDLQNLVISLHDMIRDGNNYSQLGKINEQLFSFDRVYRAKQGYNDALGCLEHEMRLIFPINYVIKNRNVKKNKNAYVQ